MSRIVTGAEWRKMGLSKAEDAAAESLRTDPEVQKIVRWLREKTVSADKIDKINAFLGNLPRIIGDCEYFKGKTLKKITENSGWLAKKIREVLKEMDIYEDGCGNDLDMLLAASFVFNISYTPLVAKEAAKTPEVLGLKDYLSLAAGMLEGISSKEGESLVNEALEQIGAKDRPYKDALTVDAVKKVSRLLIDLLPDIMNYTDGRTIKRRPPHKKTAIIVNALLDLKNSLTGDCVRKILKNIQNQ